MQMTCTDALAHHPSFDSYDHISSFPPPSKKKEKKTTVSLRKFDPFGFLKASWPAAARHRCPGISIGGTGHLFFKFFFFLFLFLKEEDEGEIVMIIYVSHKRFQINQFTLLRNITLHKLHLVCMTVIFNDAGRLKIRYFTAFCIIVSTSISSAQGGYRRLEIIIMTFYRLVERRSMA